MAYTGVIKPTNKIIAGGKPAFVQELNIETATSMYAGRLVKKGTNDDDIVVNTVAGASVGWLGFEDTAIQYRPTNVDTIYEASAKASVLSGGGFLIVGRLASGQNVSKGARLVAAASGELTVAIPAVATTGAATASAVDATTPTIDGSVGSDGIVVAIAQQSVDATSAAADIVVQSMI
jgi:hypothetical protein